jgi:Leucine-rich repeat (LRR) protein
VRFGENDAVAALAEAERRAQRAAEDPLITKLFLSDLFALAELPAALNHCTHLEELVLGCAQAPNGVTFRNPKMYEYEHWHRICGLTVLRTLDARGTNLSDLAPLKHLTALQTLNCRDTLVNDLEPLKHLTALRTLNCRNTQITDLEPLKHLTALKILYGPAAI